MNTPTSTADREIVTTRVFDAPRELVFQAWTDPAHLARWWGPNGFTTTTSHFDFRPGGSWRFVMHGPDGRDYPNNCDYIEIVPPSRIVYDHGGDDGRVHFHSTITFEEQPCGKTLVTMRAVFPTAAERDLVVREYGAIEGGKQTLARLAEFLGGK